MRKIFVLFLAFWSVLASAQLSGGLSQTAADLRYPRLTASVSRTTIPTAILPNLLADYDPSVHAYTDTATTPADATATQGTAIGSLFDYSGNAYTVSQSTSADQPALEVGIKGLFGRTALFYGGNAASALTNSSLGTAIHSGFTYLGAIQPISNGATQVLWGLSGSLYVGYLSNNVLTFQVGSQAINIPWTSGVPLILRLTVDPTNSQIRIALNGIETTTTLTGTIPSVATLALGNLPSSSFAWAGISGRNLFFTTLTEAQAAPVEQALCSELGFFNTTVFDYGDSFATGTYGVTDPSFGISQQISNFLGGTYNNVLGTGSWFCPLLGEPGHTAYDLLTSYLATAKYLVPGGTKKIIVNILGEPTNTLTGASGASGAANFNESATQAYTDMQNLCTAIKALNPNVKIVVSTVVPRNTSADSPNASGTFETRRLAYNVLLRAGSGATWDAFVDPANLTQFASAGSSGGPANTAFFNADLIHPSNQGAAIIAILFAQQDVALASAWPS